MKTSNRFLMSIAGLGGLLYGVDFGVIAAAEPYMKAMGTFTDAQISYIVGAVLLGGIISSLTAGVLAEWFRQWVAAWGWSSMFFFFAANGVLYFITALFIPETKGKTLEEIEHLWDRR